MTVDCAAGGAGRGCGALAADHVHSFGWLRAQSDGYARDAPGAVKDEALVLYAAWIYQATAQSRSVFPTDNEGPPINTSRAFFVIGRARFAEFVARPARWRECAPVKWPWRRPIVEHRSSLTDQVVTAILQSASGGGVPSRAGDRGARIVRDVVRVRPGGVRDNRTAERDAGASCELARECGG